MNSTKYNDELTREAYLNVLARKRIERRRMNTMITNAWITWSLTIIGLAGLYLFLFAMGVR